MVSCHGFPESWYSWRHQLQALAEAGFRAVAPDMRGYGNTDRPADIDQYTLLHTTGDMVGLLDALGAQSAVIAGRDWGALVAWLAALLRPDRFRGVIALSVPYVPRGKVRPTTVMPQTADAVFYQLYFQTPGVAEAELERDVRQTIRRVLYGGSGDASRHLLGDPMYVLFPISVRDLEIIGEARHREGGTHAKIEIRVRLPNGQEYPQRGLWNLNDPQVDQRTDTLIMRAITPNPDRRLIDGEFVTAVRGAQHAV